MPEPLVEVKELTVDYPVGASGFLPQRERKAVHAVASVSFDVARGETVGLVGESGSGKTTTGRAIIRRVPVTSGSIHFRGQDITRLEGAELRGLRRYMQMVFQDPYGSMNPRMRVADIIAEPLRVHKVGGHKSEVDSRVAELLRVTGLPRDAGDRYPSEFSGGQLQRIGIAKALAVDPEFIVVDEPVASLDTSIQAQVVNLLQDVQAELGVAYLFIAHDLAVVRHISKRIVVMYAGSVVEIGDRDSIYESPRHPYTMSLLSAVPVPDPALQERRERIVLQGEPPDPINPPTGCRFHPRCPFRRPGRCETEVPQLRAIVPGHSVACHWAEELTRPMLAAVESPSAVSR